MTSELVLIEIEGIMEQLDSTEKGRKMSEKDKYMIALKIQENAMKADYNRLYAAAHVVNTGLLHPSALEKIAIELENIAQNILENSKSTY